MALKGSQFSRIDINKHCNIITFKYSDGSLYGKYKLSYRLGKQL